MKESHSPTLLKVFVAGFAVMAIVLAAFGVGVTLGSGVTRQAVAAELSAQPAGETTGGAPAQQLSGLAAGSDESPAAATAAPRATETAQPRAAKPAIQPTAAPESGADENPLDMEFFNEAWALLKEQYYGELPEGKDITYAAIKGIVDSLGDKHTAFMDPEQANLFREDMEGEFEGIGAQVSEAEDGGVRIEYLFPDQPAEKAGIRVGDVVVAVDGKDVTRMSLNEAISLIRGPRDTQVELTIQRKDEAKPVELTVKRARIEMKIVETKSVSDGKIEYIKLTDFSTPSTNRMAEAVKAAVDKKPKGIILDLRGNPGGLLDASIRIGSFFIPKGNIVIERWSDGREQVYERIGRYMLNDIPLVVLVDKGSASASEIVAGAIQDAKAGTLIGETTYGKGSVQLPNNMSDGSQLKITIAKWFTPNDRSIDGTGLEPDIVVPVEEADIEAERDPQLDRAIEFLLTGK